MHWADRKEDLSMVYVLFFIISFLASIAGAICGIGGGVIIKPLLDSFGLMDVKTISFLSGCTVLADRNAARRWGGHRRRSWKKLISGIGKFL